MNVNKKILSYFYLIKFCYYYKINSSNKAKLKMENIFKTDFIEIEYLVVGAGIVGLSIAKSLAEKKKEVYILEKNSSFGLENSSRNSGVIHAGIYYNPKFLKSKLCLIGKKKLYEYLHNKKINFKNCGKLIVCQNLNEEKELLKILKKAKENKLQLKLLSAKEVEKIEPEVKCYSALLSKTTGIVDTNELMTSIVNDVESENANIVYNCKLDKIKIKNNYFLVKISNESRYLKVKNIVNAGGLYSRDIALKIKGLKKNEIPKIKFIKGDYFKINNTIPFKRLIYPIPTKNSLGIHSTFTFSNDLIFGPDSTLIEKIDFNVKKEKEEYFKNSIRTYWPRIDEFKLSPDYSGIRTKSSSNDFIIKKHTFSGNSNLINLFGMDSPGLTSCLAIGEFVADMILN